MSELITKQNMKKETQYFCPIRCADSKVETGVLHPEMEGKYFKPIPSLPSMYKRRKSFLNQSTWATRTYLPAENTSTSLMNAKSYLSGSLGNNSQVTSKKNQSALDANSYFSSDVDLQRNFTDKRNTRRHSALDARSYFSGSFTKTHSECDEWTTSGLQYIRRRSGSYEPGNGQIFDPLHIENQSKSKEFSTNSKDILKVKSNFSSKDASGNCNGINIHHEKVLESSMQSGSSLHSSTKIGQETLDTVSNDRKYEPKGYTSPFKVFQNSSHGVVKDEKPLDLPRYGSNTRCKDSDFDVSTTHKENISPFCRQVGGRPDSAIPFCRQVCLSSIEGRWSCDLSIQTDGNGDETLSNKSYSANEGDDFETNSESAEDIGEDAFQEALIALQKECKIIVSDKAFKTIDHKKECEKKDFSQQYNELLDIIPSTSTVTDSTYEMDLFPFERGDKQEKEELENSDFEEDINECVLLVENTTLEPTSPELCKICFEVVEKSMKLSNCSHILCMECAEDLLLKSPEEGVELYHCPFCL